MAAPRKERAYEKYAWVLLFLVGLVGFVSGLAFVVFPEPLDEPGIKSLTGSTWQDIVARSPGAASLARYFLRLFGLATMGFGLFGMAISALSFRRGESWAWYVLWLNLMFLVGYIVTNFSAGGSLWLPFSSFLVITLLGLVLPFRKFFPKKQPPQP